MNERQVAREQQDAYLVFGQSHGFQNVQDAARHLEDYLKQATVKEQDALRYILAVWNLQADEDLDDDACIDCGENIAWCECECSHCHQEDSNCDCDEGNRL